MASVALPSSEGERSSARRGGELGDAQEGVGHDGDNRGVAKSGEGAVGGCSGGDGVGLVPLDAAGLAATAVVSGAAEAGEGGLGGGQGEIDAGGRGLPRGRRRGRWRRRGERGRGRGGGRGSPPGRRRRAIGAPSQSPRRRRAPS